jgi:hypothetical protein
MCVHLTKIENFLEVWKTSSSIPLGLHLQLSKETLITMFDYNFILSSCRPCVVIMCRDLLWCEKWEGRIITSFLANNSCPWPTYINPLWFSWEMEISHTWRIYISTWRSSIHGSTLFVIGIKQVKIIDPISRIHHMKLVVLIKIVIPTNRNKRQKNVCYAICKCIYSRKTTSNYYFFKIMIV